MQKHYRICSVATGRPVAVHLWCADLLQPQHSPVVVRCRIFSQRRRQAPGLGRVRIYHRAERPQALSARRSVVSFSDRLSAGGRLALSLSRLSDCTEYHRGSNMVSLRLNLELYNVTSDYYENRNVRMSKFMLINQKDINIKISLAFSLIRIHENF